MTSLQSQLDDLLVETWQKALEPTNCDVLCLSIYRKYCRKILNASHLTSDLTLTFLPPSQVSLTSVLWRQSERLTYNTCSILYNNSSYCPVMCLERYPDFCCTTNFDLSCCFSSFLHSLLPDAVTELLCVHLFDFSQTNIRARTLLQLRLFSWLMCTQQRCDEGFCSLFHRLHTAERTGSSIHIKNTITAELFHSRDGALLQSTVRRINIKTQCTTSGKRGTHSGWCRRCCHSTRMTESHSSHLLPLRRRSDSWIMFRLFSTGTSQKPQTHFNIINVSQCRNNTN